jgi:hypothetical protein
MFFICTLNDICKFNYNISSSILQPLQEFLSYREAWACILMFSLSTGSTLQITEYFCTEDSFMTLNAKLTLVYLLTHHPLNHQNAMNLCA